MEQDLLTDIPQVEQHCHKDIVNEVKADAISKDGVPQH